MNQRSLKSLVTAVAGAFALLLALVAVSALRPSAASIAGGVTGIAKAAPSLTSVQAITITSPSETTPNLLGHKTHFDVLTNYGDSTSYVVVHPNDPANPGATVVITNSDLHVNSPTNITGAADYTYPASGVYNVTADHFQVISGTAQATAVSEVITVTVAQPVVDLEIADPSIALGDSAHYTVTLTNVDTNVGSSILLDLGDGNTTILTTTAGETVYTYDYTYTKPASARTVTATLVADPIYGGVYGNDLAHDVEVISVKPNVSLEPNSVTLVADGTGHQDVTAIVTDKNGDPVAGVLVKFILSFQGTNDVVTTATTGADGKAMSTVNAGTVAAVGTLTADAEGGVATIPVTFSPNNVQPVTITLDIAPVFLPSDGTSTATLTATVKDINGNGVAGIQVNFTTTDGSLSGPSAVSNAQGQAVVTLLAPVEDVVAEVEASINSSASISAKGEVFFGYEDNFEDDIDLDDGEEIDIPDLDDDIFSDIDVTLPAGVVTGHGKVRLVFRRVVTDTNKLNTDGLTTTLVFDLKLIDEAGNIVQPEKPIKIVFKLDPSKLEELGINPYTLNLERVLADGSSDEDAITDGYDPTNNTFTVTLGHLSVFREEADGEIKTFLPIQRRT